MTEERTRASRRWHGVGLAGYGFMLAGVGIFAGLVRGTGSPEQAPLLIVAWLQLAAFAVLVPFWVTRRSTEGTLAGLGVIFARILCFGVLGLAALLVNVVGAEARAWKQALLLEGVVGCYAALSAGVATLVLAAVRKRLAAQLVATAIGLALLAAPLVANPLILWVGSAHRTLVIDCTSYASALVVSAYAIEVDFYRGPGMYVWSVAGDYAFRIPQAWLACLLYLGAGVVLLAAFRPTIKRLT